ncbi:MAG: SMI1/KNR4 family protein [Rhabdochlamydiaceae bacterium]
MERAKSKQEDMYRVGYSQFVPCTVEEVEKIEICIGHCLPEAYREFLLWMGHSGGGFLRGSNCFYRDLRNLQESAQELLDEDQFPGKLPKDAFVFFMHQGYQFNFFCLDEGDDPPVLCYLEEEPVKTSFFQIYPRFSDFVITEIEGHIKIKDTIKASEMRRMQNELNRKRDINNRE